MSNREQVQLMKRAANSYCDTLAWPTVILITIVFPAYFLTPIAVGRGTNACGCGNACDGFSNVCRLHRAT